MISPDGSKGSRFNPVSEERGRGRGCPIVRFMELVRVHGGREGTSIFLYPVSSDYLNLWGYGYGNGYGFTGFYYDTYGIKDFDVEGIRHRSQKEHREYIQLPIWPALDWQARMFGYIWRSVPIWRLAWEEKGRMRKVIILSESCPIIRKYHITRLIPAKDMR